jgi:hypothetical protein
LPSNRVVWQHHTLMKKFTLILSVIMAAVCFGLRSHAQGVLAPLFLYTNGAGSITPLQDGQLLEVGLSYDMTAIPDSGSVFSSWQPVNVFTQTTFVIDENGITNSLVSVTAAPVSSYTTQPLLEFTMQPTTVILNNPGVSTITENSGWQANFAQVPEPSAVWLVTCGLPVLLWLRVATSDDAA